MLNQLLVQSDSPWKIWVSWQLMSANCWHTSDLFRFLLSWKQKIKYSKTHNLKTITKSTLLQLPLQIFQAFYLAFHLPESSVRIQPTTLPATAVLTGQSASKYTVKFIFHIAIKVDLILTNLFFKLNWNSNLFQLLFHFSKIIQS